MKIKDILFFSCLLTGYFTYSQKIKPIEIKSDNKKIVYNSSTHKSNKKLVQNQAYELNLKLSRDIKLVDNNKENHIKKCLSSTFYNSIKSKKIIFFIEQVIDNKGNVISSSLINYGVKVNFTPIQIECILSKSMNNSYSFSNVANNSESFYMIVRKRYKL